MVSGEKKKLNLAFWILPILVYFIVFSFTQIVAYAGNCHGGWEMCWSRWDSGLYLEISKIGRTLFICGKANGYPPGSTDWCGNSGWAPFYSFLIYLFHQVSGLDNAVCGILLTNAFFIGFLFMIAAIIKVQSFNLSNWLTLLLCGICPGGIYFFGIFPLALMVLLVSIIFWAVQNQKYYVAAVPSFLIALSYSSAIIVFFSFGLYILYLFWVNRTRKNLRYLLLEMKDQLVSKSIFRTHLFTILVPGLLGMLSLYAYDWVHSGHWNAMYMIQGKYGHSMYSPFKLLKEHYNFFLEHLPTTTAWIDFHNIFFFFTIPFLLYLFIKHRGPITPFAIIYTFIMWYIPFCIGILVSLYRSIALLAPAMVFLHPMKNASKIIILLVFGIFYYYMGILFIQSTLH